MVLSNSTVRQHVTHVLASQVWIPIVGRGPTYAPFVSTSSSVNQLLNSLRMPSTNRGSSTRAGTDSQLSCQTSLCGQRSSPGRGMFTSDIGRCRYLPSSIHPSCRSTCTEGSYTEITETNNAVGNAVCE